MTENEVKAINWMKNVRDDAIVTLDHIEKNEPNVSPMLYAGRKEKAETIIKGFEELEQYRSIGTVEECREAREKQIPKEPVDDTAFGTCSNCHNEFNSELINEYDMKYCLYCGQALKADVETKTEAWKERFAKRFDRFE